MKADEESAFDVNTIQKSNKSIKNLKKFSFINTFSAQHQ